MSKVKIEGNASGTGTLTIAAPNTNTDRTLDIPDAAGDLVVAEGGTFKIDSSGNVGIGTSSPTTKAEIVTSNTNTDGLTLTADGSSFGYASNLYFKSKLQVGGSLITAGKITSQSSGANNSYMSFSTTASGTNTERMRIDSSGNLLVGTSSAISNFQGISLLGRTDASSWSFVQRQKDRGRYVQHTATSGTAYSDYFEYNGVEVGSIRQTSSGTSYYTSSDYRLKTDVQPMTGATERLKQLKPVNFEWINSGERVDGFIAHEAQEVVPEAVGGEKDAMRTEEYEVTPAVLDDDGNVVTEAVMGEREVPDYQGIDQSKLVPLLTAALQEQQAVIEDLTARIAALESV